MWTLESNCLGLNSGSTIPYLPTSGKLTLASQFASPLGREGHPCPPCWMVGKIKGDHGLGTVCHVSSYCLFIIIALSDVLFQAFPPIFPSSFLPQNFLVTWWQWLFISKILSDSELELLGFFHVAGIAVGVLGSTGEVGVVTAPRSQPYKGARTVSANCHLTQNVVSAPTCV